MTRLSNAGNPIDLITLQEELERSEQLEEAGGFAYLVEIAKNTPSAANISAYAESCAACRGTGDDLGRQRDSRSGLHNPRGVPPTICWTWPSKVFQIAEQRTSANEGPQPLKLILEQTVDKIEGAVSKTPTTG